MTTRETRELGKLWWSRNDLRKAVRSTWPELGQFLDDHTHPPDPHEEARGVCPVKVGDQVAWTEEQRTYDGETGEFVPTGTTLHFTGEVRRIEVDTRWLDEWTAYVSDQDDRPHGLNAARLTRVLV